jgi:hypothetical protein
MELLRTQPEKAHLEHPEILINGWGLAVEAVYSGLGVVKEVYKSSRDFKNAEMSFHLTTKSGSSACQVSLQSFWGWVSGNCLKQIHGWFALRPESPVYV